MDVRRRLRNGKGETKDDPEEPTQEWRPFWVPHCLLQPPRPSLNSKGQTQPATNEGSEGIQKEKRVTLWGLVLMVGGGLCLKVCYRSLSSSVGTKTPTQGEDEHKPRVVGTRGWWWRFLEGHPVILPPTNQRRVTHLQPSPQMSLL